MKTTVQEVYDVFLSKIVDYDYAKFSEQDLQTELLYKLKSAIAKFLYADEITINEYTDEFNRELSSLEIEVLAYGMVLAWVEPMVNSVEVMKQRLGSKDFQMFSQANHAKELREIKIQATRDFDYWQNRYYSFKRIKEMKK